MYALKDNHLSARSSNLDYRVTTLSNGLRAVSINLPHVESATVAAFVNAGSRNETPELNGISHYLEHMAFKGTTSRTAHQILCELEFLGADVNAFTSKDRTAYHVTGLKDNVDTFVELIADVLKNSTFPEDEIERERDVIQQEILMGRDNNTRMAYQLHDQVLYGDHPLARPIIGSPENVAAIKRDDLVAYMNQYYTGSNMIVGIVGNVDHDFALELIEKNFGDIPQGTVNVTTRPTQASGYAGQDRPSEQSVVLLSFPAADSVDPLHYAEAVASAVLSDGMSSPLFNEVREIRGLAYSVTSFTDMLDNTGSFYLKSATTADNLEELLPVMIEEMQKLTNHVSATDLQRAKNQIRVGLTRGQERCFGLLNSVIENLFTYGFHPSTQELIDKVNAVTADDVKEVFERWLASKPTLTISGPGHTERLYDLVLHTLGQHAPGSLGRLRDEMLQDPEFAAAYNETKEMLEAMRLGNQTS
jgi:predicted Zn-dependent peptidase